MGKRPEPGRDPARQEGPDQHGPSDDRQDRRSLNLNQIVEGPGELPAESMRASVVMKYRVTLLFFRIDLGRGAFSGHGDAPRELLRWLTLLNFIREYDSKLHAC